MKPKNRYVQVLEKVFFAHYQPGDQVVEFERQEFEGAARELGIKLPKNLGDIIYSFRYRSSLPASILATAPEGQTWIIRGIRKGRYGFVITKPLLILPNTMLAETKIPDATPGVITLYTSGDEQALLAILRYNRLIDIFTGVTCYSLQSHLRTTLPNGTQVETDEIYVGLDRRGAHYVFPVQAKGRHETLGTVQIEQDFALCEAQFPSLICRPIGAQFIEQNLLALFEFEATESGVAIAAEKHYRLVASDDVSISDLESYRTRSL